MYLLNHDVVFELLKSSSCDNVSNWCKAIAPSDLYISVITIGNLIKKVQKDISIQQKSLFQFWLQTNFLAWFGENVLSVDLRIIQRWGHVIPDSYTSTVDSLLIATAIEHNLVLVTSLYATNRISYLKLFNPFI
ncbi:PIN domain-containing protein [Candidatus Sneabacter namystus]|uniref:Type II toxin-antitoxin system VapC family toxin n=1 Tax=Candidatus Sneabacter namystus TaxID=2601646 RepID=A0A5C0UJD3_9RICK|nr:PIN domain-containing protein [Candidatus Sneabacter namystus]QEK39899.1 type II toxin-antitoxin system VapC family toxin [Candidatus Sneabacter namystus]